MTEQEKLQKLKYLLGTEVQFRTRAGIELTGRVIGVLVEHNECLTIASGAFEFRQRLEDLVEPPKTVTAYAYKDQFEVLRWALKEDQELVQYGGWKRAPEFDIVKEVN